MSYVHCCVLCSPSRKVETFERVGKCALRRNTASELASLSGGRYVNFVTQRSFEDNLQRISNQIHSYYVLSFQPTAAPALSLHSLRVRVAGYPDAVIQSRRSYWPGILDSSNGDNR
jgi:hypothetical protein